MKYTLNFAEAWVIMVIIMQRGQNMKNLSLLVWLTQLGLSVVAPLVGYVLLALWLRSRFSWGNWVIWCGAAIGLISAVDGLRGSLRLMSRMAKDRQEDDTPPPVSFNNHD